MTIRVLEHITLRQITQSLIANMYRDLQIMTLYLTEKILLLIDLHLLINTIFQDYTLIQA